MKIKLTILTIIMILISTYCKAQCKLDKENDEWNNKEKISTKYLTIIGGNAFDFLQSQMWSLDIRLLSDENGLSFILKHEINHGVNPNSPSYISLIYFKFSDGTIYKKEDPIQAGERNDGPLSYAFTRFEIEKEELRKFSSQTLVKVHLVFDSFSQESTTDKEINHRRSDNIKEAAACLFRELRQ